MSVKRRDLLKDAASLLATAAIPISWPSNFPGAVATQTATPQHSTTQLFLAKAEAAKLLFARGLPAPGWAHSRRRFRKARTESFRRFSPPLRHTIRSGLTGLRREHRRHGNRSRPLAHCTPTAQISHCHGHARGPVSRPEKYLDLLRLAQRAAARCRHAGLTYLLSKKGQALAAQLGQKSDTESLGVPAAKMSAAARAHHYDAAQSLFVSGPEKQISWASQAWLVIAQILSKDENASVLQTALKQKTILTPATPYLNHYVLETLHLAGLHADAQALLDRYWGGIVRAGADTFWEVYDPADSKASPYGDVHINSFCHAWSCTPSYFLRKPLL